MILNDRVQFNPNSVIPDPSLITQDSYNCAFHRSSGILEFNSKRINPGAGAFSTNLWQVTGYIEVKAIYGEFTDVTNVVGGPTVCSFDLNDGIATVQITSAAGVNCAGVTLGSIIKKDMAVANAATLLDASQCRFSELTVGGAARQFFGFDVLQKNGIATFIRFTCTTLAANDFTMNFGIIWTCRYPGSSLAAV